MGSGYTPIWVASHIGLLKKAGHEVSYFDALFYASWSDNYTAKNTETQMYAPSDYEIHIEWKKDDVVASLQSVVDDFCPDIIFWSAISSHIHSEGEYVCVQYGHDLLGSVKTKALKIASGIQPTVDPGLMMDIFPGVDYYVRGESEFVLRDIAGRYDKKKSFDDLQGLAFKKNNAIVINPPQPLVTDMDLLEPYDYSVFEDQVFYRPYNGKVVRAVDYEMSRGCPFTCDYCAEVAIQKYYGFRERGKNGALKEAGRYMRCKSIGRIFEEIKKTHQERNVVFFRCQDTNFLTIPPRVLNGLADKIQGAGLPVFFYVETRPELINPSNVAILKKLRVDGVGMGIETASEDFCATQLHRFCKQSDIIKAFKLLKDAGIKRTTYNVLGFRDQTEEMILDTIRFNRLLDPDNISTSFYSPYIGTAEHQRSVEQGYFAPYEYNLNDGLYSATKSRLVTKEKLQFYRKHFTKLVRGGLEQLADLKEKEGVA